MSTAPTPETPDAAPRVQRVRKAAVLGVLLTGGAAGLGFGLAELLGSGAGAAALAAAAVGAAASLLVLNLTRQLDRSRAQLTRLDTVDRLTGAAKQGPFMVLAQREWARARRYGSGAALLLVDIDRFARLCEAHGSAAGDAALRTLAQHTGPTLRGADALARFGPARLAVWLAHADPIGALDVAERIRERAEGLDIGFDGVTLRVTVSVGVAALRPAHQNLGALVEDAEAAAQAARQSGGNCVRAAPVDPTRLRRIGPSVGDNQAAGPL